MPIEMAIQRLKQRRTKIVATLGPSSSGTETVELLIRAGVNVFRLNMSHGSHESHRATYDRVRAAARRAAEPVAVLADLSGPKIRAGRFRGGEVALEAGERVTITTRDVEGGPGLIPSQYEALAADVRPQDRILLDDGNLELRVESVEGTEVQATVVQGGVLKDRKGMNLPGVNVSAPALTDKDREDAAFALGLGVDYLALSFVRRASDVEALRALVGSAGRGAEIIAKIEKPEALEDIEAILDASDGVMVARGDLGVELPPEVVPIAQSQLVEMARARSKPVIVATQMLESMVASARPTRAEVSDVSQAVSSGADAVMLSAETASGAYPVQAVEMMDRVARLTEGHLWRQGAFGGIGRAREGARPLPVGEAVARAVALLSRDLMVRAIVVVSRSGKTAALMASARPQAPVLAASPDPATVRRMSLLWGVLPVHVRENDLDDLHGFARGLARRAGLAADGDHILEVRRFDPDPARSTPTMTVLRV